MKEKPIKKTASNVITASQQAEIDDLAALLDDQIDTQDIPEQLDWTDKKRGVFYRPNKLQMTLWIDADSGMV
jgi:hypothetical protein